MCVDDFKSLLLESGVGSDIVCTLNGLLPLPECTAQNIVMFAEECGV